MLNESMLRAILSQRNETPKIELKLKYVLSGQGKGKALDEIAKDIIALVNTAGRHPDDYAYLIIGAGNNTQTDGKRERADVRQYCYEPSFFLNIANARCSPSIPDIRYDEMEVDGNYYGVLSIPPSPHMHTLTRDLDTPKGAWHKGSVLIRHGDGVAVASYEDMVVMKREKERLIATDDLATEISELISRVQSKSRPLSQSVAEALTLARKVGHSTLAHICAKELSGWDSSDMADDAVYQPTYRLMEVFVGTHQLNMQYVGFGVYSNTIDFLRHSGEFIATKRLMSEPLSQLEAKAPPNPDKSIGSLETTLGALNRDSTQPDQRVYCYFSPFTFENIIQAVRGELTKHLIDLLPPAHT
jgi:hypothetical protein